MNHPTAAAPEPGVSTRERILLAALELFSREGFEGLSVSALASRLGMAKSAMYRHYRSKQELFDSIVKAMEERDARQAAGSAMPLTPDAVPLQTGPAEALKALRGYSLAMFRYWAADPFAAPFRRLLTLEQYRSAPMGRLFQQYLASGPLDYLTNYFAALGLKDPRAAALRLWSPLFLLLSLADSGRADEAREEGEHHLALFFDSLAATLTPSDRKE